MPVRRMLLFVFGVWLGGSLFTSWMVVSGFGAVDDALKAPSAQLQEVVKPLGQENTRLLLRFQVAELGRRMMQRWGIVQIVFSVAALLLILFATSEGRVTLILASLLLVIVLIQQFAVIPNIVGLGRFLDFLPPSQALAERGELRATNMAYTAIEIFKMLVGGVLIWQLFRPKRRSSSHVSG